MFFPLAVLTIAGCSGDSFSDFGDEDWGTLPGGGTTPGTGKAGTMASSELTQFSINVDSTALSESETIDAEDEDYVENNSFKNTITITYNGSSATKSGDDNDLVSISGSNVTLNPTKKTHIVLKGSTTAGQFRINDNDDAKKCLLELSGVSITGADGPAINIQSGKRCYVVLTDGTVNHLSDGDDYAQSDEDRKATFFSEGELLFSGKGSLRVSSTKKNGIQSDDYIMTRPGTNIYVKSTSGHGIKSNDALIIRGGVINVEVSAEAAKGLTTDGYYLQQGGRVTSITTGDAKYDSDDLDVSGSSGLKADSIVTIDGGQLLCRSTGKGGKGISTDQIFNMNDGAVSVITTGSTYTYNRSLDSKPKGIKADGNININGGTVMVRATGGDGAEGIESKAVLTVNGGKVQSYAYDDAFNSASHLYVKGGEVSAFSSNNDALDANGNMYLEGGTVYAYGGGSPEMGLDSNDEGGYATYITGGTVFACGGSQMPISSTTGSQPFVQLSGSIDASASVSLKSGSTSLLSFTMMRGTSGYFLVSTPEMKSGTSYTLYSGSTQVGLASAVTSASSGMGGGGRRW